jgi:hypothetical protein
MTLYITEEFLKMTQMSIQKKIQIKKEDVSHYFVYILQQY